MGRHAQNRRRGGGGVLTVQEAPSTFAPPDLDSPDGGSLEWTWTHDNPDHFRLQTKLLPGDPWTLYYDYPGDQRDTGGPVDTGYYRITPQAAGGTDLSAPSNTVDIMTPP